MVTEQVMDRTPKNAASAGRSRTLEHQLPAATVRVSDLVLLSRAGSIFVDCAPRPIVDFFGPIRFNT
jgi:hypothetical protein